MPKVLIITYYWPPSGGIGVQRWLKFSKYLPDNNWTPIIVTPENPAFDIKDEKLLQEVREEADVIRIPILEPFRIYRRIFGKKGPATKQGIVNDSGKASLFEKLSVWVRGNLFIPDPRVFWIRPTTKFLRKYLKENAVDVMVTTGPPHSMHLIGLNLKKEFGIKWIADFRDPWSDWDVFPELKTSDWALRMHRKKEDRVLKNCDLLLTVSPRLASNYTDKCKEVKVITNGFDGQVFENHSKVDRFRLTYAGMLNERRNSEILWSVLEELCSENEGFSNDLNITLAGNISNYVLDRIKNGVLINNLEYVEYLPHDEVYQLYRRSSVLLLLLNQTSCAKWILPGKMFEYIQANRFILGIGPEDSDANDLFKKIQVDELIGFNDREKLKSRLLDYYEKWESGVMPNRGGAIERYSRQNLTKELVQVFENITSPSD